MGMCGLICMCVQCFTTCFRAVSYNPFPFKGSPALKNNFPNNGGGEGLRYVTKICYLLQLANQLICYCLRVPLLLYCSWFSTLLICSLDTLHLLFIQCILHFLFAHWLIEIRRTQLDIVIHFSMAQKKMVALNHYQKHYSGESFKKICCFLTPSRSSKTVILTSLFRQ